MDDLDGVQVFECGDQLGSVELSANVVETAVLADVMHEFPVGGVAEAEVCAELGSRSLTGLRRVCEHQSHYIGISKWYPAILLGEAGRVFKIAE